MKRSLKWLASYQLVRLLVGFFLGTWVARVLGPAKFGVIATAAAVGAIAYCFVELGMKQLLIKELSRRKRIGGLVAGTIFKLWLALGIVTCGVTAAWNALTDALPWSVYWATMVPLLLTALLVHNNWEEAEQRAFVAARNNMAGYLAAAVARVASVIWLPTVAAIAWTFLLENIIAGVLGMWISHRRGRGLWLKGWDKRIAKAVFSRGMVLVIGHAGTLLLLRADTVMIQQMRGDHEAGIYGAAVRLSELVYLLSPMLVTVLLPRLSMLLKSKDEPHFRELAERGSGLMALVGMASALGLLIAGPITIRYLFGLQYEASVPVLLVHCLGAVPYFQAEWRYAVMVAADRAQVTAWLSWLAVMVNIGLNLLWIPQHGALGAAWATLISYSVCGIAATWLVADLRWFAWGQLRALLAPFGWIARPRQNLAEWQQMLARAPA
jgi:O-antigen/teichoic acid export membrane protein